ncbi:DUF4328 domain-containing protein [Kitasatospora sp. NPDC001175]|uniref:DUF4328 domain-containing protein n=1 Tax=Kitasatospora sp. NPDC001175 TaxID=3157103 RepID=UPI003D00270E
MQSETIDVTTVPAAPGVSDPRELATGLFVATAGELALQVAITMTGGTQGHLARAMPLLGVFVVISTIVLLCWLRRCRLNAEILAPGTHRYAPGFAVGGWFIPVAMWWIPRRIVLDIRRASGLSGRGWPVEGWWWTRLAKLPVAAALTCAGVKSNPLLSPYTMPLGVAAAVLMILMVREITAAQASRLTP